MRRIVLSIIVVVLSVFCTNAQDKTLYFMSRVPQSSFLNPAVAPEFNTYVGFPGLSNVSLAYNNSSFALVDVLKRGTGLQRDSLVFDVNGLERQLGKINFIRLDNNVDALSFGFRSHNFYGHFNVSVRTSASFAYPKDLISIKNGNYDFVNDRPRTINLSDLALDGYSYGEIGFGLSQEVNEKLNVGARLRLLSGIAAIKTSKFKANIVTSDDFQKSTMNVDAVMYVSAPRLSFTLDSEGKIEDVSFDKDKSGASSDYSFGSNLGLGIDLGATYKFDDRFTFYGSINDLGFIRWNTNGYKLVSKGTYVFNGADITPDANGDVDFEKAMEAVVDTLKSKFKPTDSDAKFTTMLKSKLYLGSTYKAFDWLTCGALFRGGFYGSYFDPALTLSANATPCKGVGVSLSYSICNRNFNNFGAGIALGGRPMQFYFVVDNILSRYINAKSGDSSPVMVPGYTRSVNFQFGINLMFGSRDKKKNQDHAIECVMPTGRQ